jgi:hypothetical protein
MKKHVMTRSFRFVFHAFISANMIPSSNHSCRKTYRLAGVYLEKYSWQVFIVNNSRRNGYAPAVHVDVQDAVGRWCCVLAHKAGKQGFLRQKNVVRHADPCRWFSVFCASPVVQLRCHIGPVMLFLCRHLH